MNLAYKKILGKFTKVLGFGKTPPPMLGKIPKWYRFFFLRAYLIHLDIHLSIRIKGLQIWDNCFFSSEFYHFLLWLETEKQNKAKQLLDPIKLDDLVQTIHSWHPRALLLTKYSSISHRIALQLKRNSKRKAECTFEFVSRGVQYFIAGGQKMKLQKKPKCIFQFTRPDCCSLAQRLCQRRTLWKCMD